jgi:hypothetical protein
MADLGRNPEDQLEQVALTMPPHDLMEVVRRLRDEAQGGHADAEADRRSHEIESQAAGFQSAWQTCEVILDALADSEEGEIHVSRAYLKGSLYCGRCGSRMSLIQAKGNGGRYPYFFCIGRMKGTGCKQPYVPVDLIETAVEDAYGDVAIKREQADLVREKLEVALAGMREQAELRPLASVGDWRR